MTDDHGKKGNYEVGYGKPPKQTQWKKGQSGNPSGKRKKTETLHAKLAKLAGEEIALSFNGSETTMTRDLAMLHSVLQKAMKGDQPSVRYVTDMLDRLEGPVAAPPRFTITPDDINILHRRADWVALIEEAEATRRDEDPHRSQEEGEDDSLGF